MQGLLGYANSRVIGQEIPFVLLRLKVYHRVYNSPHWALSWVSFIQLTFLHSIYKKIILISSSYHAQVFQVVSPIPEF